ncbi:hypothetical protein [Lactococcus formosensis]|uniref:Uncharacterized protein n=1 Tax=Lactococcus formosensis TaxID=1281486 RepID=A0A9Q9D813_9LACT|nr:hypothetical protein [Lactococcus formosensis]USJ21446.1 hypothetical protein LMK00_05465 [Lactococcus formosensis]
MKKYYVFNKFCFWSMNILILFGTLFSNNFEFRQLNVHAETANTILKPGETIDTGNHFWTINDFQSSKNYTPVGKNTKGSGWEDKKTFNFGVNKKTQALG